MNPRRNAAALGVVSEPDAVAALGDPHRRRMLEALKAEPDSAAGLARRTGESRQRLNYHLRALESVGLIELLEERRKGNCTERIMRPVARGFVIDPAALGELAIRPEHSGDRFSATYLLALAARLIRELVSLRVRARRDRKRLATAAIETKVELESPEAFAAFVDDLARAVGRVVARHHLESPEARPFRVILGAHPAPHPSETENEDE